MTLELTESTEAASFDEEIGFRQISAHTLITVPDITACAEGSDATTFSPRGATSRLAASTKYGLLAVVTVGGVLLYDAKRAEDISFTEGLQKGEETFELNEQSLSIRATIEIRDGEGSSTPSHVVFLDDGLRLAVAVSSHLVIIDVSEAIQQFSESSQPTVCDLHSREISSCFTVVALPSFHEIQSLSISPIESTTKFVTCLDSHGTVTMLDTTTKGSYKIVDLGLDGIITVIGVFGPNDKNELFILVGRNDAVLELYRWVVGNPAELLGTVLLEEQIGTVLETTENVSCVGITPIDQTSASIVISSDDRFLNAVVNFELEDIRDPLPFTITALPEIMFVANGEEVDSAEEGSIVGSTRVRRVAQSSVKLHSKTIDSVTIVTSQSADEAGVIVKSQDGTIFYAITLETETIVYPFDTFCVGVASFETSWNTSIKKTPSSKADSTLLPPGWPMTFMLLQDRCLIGFYIIGDSVMDQTQKPLCESLPIELPILDSYIDGKDEKSKVEQPSIVSTPSNKALSTKDQDSATDSSYSDDSISETKETLTGPDTPTPKPIFSFDTKVPKESIKEHETQTAKPLFTFANEPANEPKNEAAKPLFSFAKESANEPEKQTAKPLFSFAKEPETEPAKPLFSFDTKTSSSKEPTNEHEKQVEKPLFSFASILSTSKEPVNEFTKEISKGTEKVNEKQSVESSFSFKSQLPSVGTFTAPNGSKGGTTTVVNSPLDALRTARKQQGLHEVPSMEQKSSTGANHLGDVARLDNSLLEATRRVVISDAASRQEALSNRMADIFMKTDSAMKLVDMATARATACGQATVELDACSELMTSSASATGQTTTTKMKLESVVRDMEGFRDSFHLMEGGNDEEKVGYLLATPMEHRRRLDHWCRVFEEEVLVPVGAAHVAVESVAQKLAAMETRVEEVWRSVDTDSGGDVVPREVARAAFLAEEMPLKAANLRLGLASLERYAEQHCRWVVDSEGSGVRELFLGVPERIESSATLLRSVSVMSNAGVVLAQRLEELRRVAQHRARIGEW